MKKTLLATPVLALALAIGTPTVSHADDDAATETASSIQWVDGWSNGLAAAKKSGKLMFVYVGRKSPT